jgi:hypothetical protein
MSTIHEHAWSSSSARSFVEVMSQRPRSSDSVGLVGDSLGVLVLLLLCGEGVGDLDP